MPIEHAMKTMTTSPVRPFRMRLAYHLIVVLTVKFVLLALLWHTFIQPYKVRVDPGVMGERIAGVSSNASHVSRASRASIPTSSGDKQ
jgi:hypothetical protein